MSEPDLVRQFFEAKAFEYAPASAPREICGALVKGALTGDDLKLILAKYGLTRDRLMHCVFLDWIIEYVRQALAHGAFATDFVDDVHALKAVLGIGSGDFYALRAAEIKALLCDQLELVLEDGTLTEHEELGQLALQGAFDLSRDKYLALTSRLYERAVIDMRMAMAWALPPELPALTSRLQCLETICNLTGDHRRSIGGTR